MRLVNPNTIKRYMLGTTVVSEWKAAAPILWRGKWKGKRYEDKGVVLGGRTQAPPSVQPFQRSRGPAGRSREPPPVHDRALAGERSRGARALPGLQSTEEARKHSEQNWQAMLASLKDLLEA
jgi:hypothetical protein